MRFTAWIGEFGPSEYHPGKNYPDYPTKNYTPLREAEMARHLEASLSSKAEKSGREKERGPAVEEISSK
jgi:hypothetical protein